MSTRATNLKRLAIGATAASLLAFGGVAYAQQQGAEPQQAPQGQEQQSPGGDRDCPWKQDGGGTQESPQTEV
ncbi:MAG: hypothetical protein ACRDTR_14480 [Rubrobacter sp.]